MTDTSFAVIALAILFALAFGIGGITGKNVGKDNLKDRIIAECVARNPDMANSKINQYCTDQFNSLLPK